MFSLWIVLNWLHQLNWVASSLHSFRGWYMFFPIPPSDLEVGTLSGKLHSVSQWPIHFKQFHCQNWICGHYEILQDLSVTRKRAGLGECQHTWQYDGHIVCNYWDSHGIHCHTLWLRKNWDYKGTEKCFPSGSVSRERQSRQSGSRAPRLDKGNSEKETEAVAKGEGGIAWN